MAYLSFHFFGGDGIDFLMIVGLKKGGTKLYHFCPTEQREKSIRETDITKRDMLIVSTFPVSPTFSASPTQ